MKLLLYLSHLLSWTTLMVQAHPPAVPEPTLNRRATTCNGHAELCSRSFGNITFIGSHDSYAIGTSVGSNQDQSVMQQLNDGIRMLQMQAHNANGTIKLCHSSCSLVYDGGTLQDYLKIVKTWLDANPNEVLSLLIVNIDNMPATQYATVFSSVGLDTMSYSPTTLPLPASGWPTLGALIDSGKRLITFIDNTADPTTVPYIIDEFPNIWETAYDVTDATFDCQVNRTKGDTATQMYLINHFLDTAVLGAFIPNIVKLDQTNSATGFGSIGAQVSTCVSSHGRPPNFILVDFYEYGGGSVFQVAAGINGVGYSPASPIAVPSRTGTATTSSVTSSPLTRSASPPSIHLSPLITVLFTLSISGLVVF